MLLSAVSVLVVAQSSSEIPEGLMNNSVYHIISNRYVWLSYAFCGIFGHHIILVLACKGHLVLTWGGGEPLEIYFIHSVNKEIHCNNLWFIFHKNPFIWQCYHSVLNLLSSSSLSTNLRVNTLRTGLLNCLNARSRGLTFRHRASCV